jgi:hypothetical protein
MIDRLTHELSVLSKAIVHKNLSAAAVHIGLSQPQLSRLIAKLEHELNLVLLDRSSRRKSGWTQAAHDLSIAYNRGMGRLETDILALAQNSEALDLRIGTLEGLSSIAVSFTKDCFKNTSLKNIYLNVFDFKELESHFLNNNLDLIFTVRSPSKQKYVHVIEVGYQQIEKIATKDILVASESELATIDKKSRDAFSNQFISNSLSIRRQWLKEHGGTGSLPVDAKTGKGKGQYTIYLYGSHIISPSLWNKISKLFS